ncbi:glyoxalase [uncultured Lacinutrix sp.]|uniref:glyoxalase n=1 Tax=uncultured Lacinutrix sp. TaxID=574032 RepID=UPI0026253475|nr:glyoxalase [uncultured Lacinutrix sp.]
MSARDQHLLAIRPIISSIRISDNMSKDERFQNITLRPIIKLQNDLFIEVFRNYIKKHKNVFYELTLERRQHYIDNAIHKDIKFRNSLKGMVIGQFTTNEYSIYIENSSALNKRMMNIVIQRLQSNIQLFETPEMLKAV